MKKTIKVLHLSASDSGGAFVFAQNLIDNSKDEIEANHLIYTGEKSNFHYIKIKFLDEFIKFGLHAFEKFILMFYEKNPKNRFKFSLGFPGIPYFILKRFFRNYDIIHIHWLNKGFININDLKKIKKPLVWTCHDIWIGTGGCHLTQGCENFKNGCGNCLYLKNPNNNDLSKKLFNQKQSIINKTNISFITPSSWLKNQLSKSSILNNQTIRVIHNGVNTNIFSNLNLKNNKKDLKIGFVAQNLNDENKALFRLINVLNSIDDYKIELLLVGEKKAEFDFHIKCKYQITGTIDNKFKMNELYNQMDVLVCTSSIETFPTTLMEASCCGVKCLGFDVGGVKEILDLCQGESIQPFDLTSLNEKINFFTYNFIDRNEIATSAIEHFSIKSTCEKYSQLYQSIMKN